MRQTLNHHFWYQLFLQDSTDYDEDGFSNVFPLWRDFNPTHPRKWRVKSGVLFKNSDITHWGKNQLFIQKFDLWKMWILWKMRLWNCGFCEKWVFEKVNFVKNEILKLWILWKMTFSKCEFLDRLRIFASVWFTKKTRLFKNHLLLAKCLN